MVFYGSQWFCTPYYISLTLLIPCLAVLDLLAKPMFCAFHVTALRDVPYTQYQLQTGKYFLGASRAVENADKMMGVTVESHTKITPSETIAETGNGDGNRVAPALTAPTTGTPSID
jgi:hypothetical protein